MNADIRLSITFPSHPKTLKLIRKLQDPMAPWMLVQLWIYTAHQRPDGVLHGMDAEDIEAVVGWAGDDCRFVQVLLDVGYLDVLPDGCLVCHDWIDHNPWVAESEDRSDQARFSRLAQVAPKIHADLKDSGVKSVSKHDYELAKKAERAGKRLADIIDDLANAGDSPATASDQLAPAPAPAPEPIKDIIYNDTSSRISDPTPPAEESQSSSMDLFEFRIGYEQTFGELMPGTLNEQATRLCRKYSREKIKNAFEITALQNGKSLKYLMQVLEGKPKPQPRGRDRPNRQEESVQRGRDNLAVAMEVIYASQGV